MTTFDDPLFAEDWAARSGYGVPLKHYEPEFGERTWDIDDAALDAARAHANIEGTDEDALLRHYLESALEALDGYDGALGVVLQQRTVLQPFAHLSFILPIIGPIVTGAMYPMTLRYRRYGEHDEDDWVTVDARDYGVARTARGPEIRLRATFFREYYAHLPVTGEYDTEPRADFAYTAGFGTNLSSLPPDLRQAIYIMARRSYDFRDDMQPQALGSLALGVESILARYRRVWQ